MAWTDLSGAFTFGSKLTSAQMQGLRDNIGAAFQNDSGSPLLVLNAGSEHYARLQPFSAGSDWFHFKNSAVSCVGSATDQGRQILAAHFTAPGTFTAIWIATNGAGGGETLSVGINRRNFLGSSVNVFTTSYTNPNTTEYTSIGVAAGDSITMVVSHGSIGAAGQYSNIGSVYLMVGSKHLVPDRLYFTITDSL